MEIWDAYLDNRTKTGTYLERGKPIPPGLFHLVVEAIIIHEDGSLLFTQRDAAKASYPNHFEASAGGSALAGEDSLTAVLREIAEETGLRLKAQDCQLHHQFVNDEHACLFDVFIARTAADKTSVRLQAKETTDAIWVVPQELHTFLTTHLVIPRQKAFLLSPIFQDYLKKHPQYRASLDE